MSARWDSDKFRHGSHWKCWIPTTCRQYYRFPAICWRSHRHTQDLSHTLGFWSSNGWKGWKLVGIFLVIRPIFMKLSLSYFQNDKLRMISYQNITQISFSLFLFNWFFSDKMPMIITQIILIFDFFLFENLRHFHDSFQIDKLFLPIIIKPRRLF